MLLRISALALCVIGTLPVPTKAISASLTYSYAGEEFTCPPTNTDPQCGQYDGLPGFKYSFSIDEALYPATAIAGTKLYLFQDFEYQPGNDYVPSVWGYSINDGEFSETFNTGLFDDSLIPWLTIDSFMLTWFDGVFGPNDFTYIFDDSRNIISWYGDSYQGGSNDPFTNTVGDRYAGGAVSKGPGTWTVTEPVAPIPLPPTMLLVLSSLVVLNFLRRRAVALG